MKSLRRPYVRSSVILSCIFAVAGCGGSSGGGGGGGGSGQDTSNAGPDPEADYNVQLSGSVGDGPIANAELSVRTNDGELLETFFSDQDAAYNIEFKTKGKHYPLLIEAAGGTDLVTNLPPDFTLSTVLTEPRNKAVANLTPFSTLAVAAARAMPGGFSSSNITKALDAVMEEFSFGLTSLAGDGAMTTAIDDSNVAEIVKASEALAELFRRTDAAMFASVGESSIDDVVAALGADLVDGRLDGSGPAGTDAHVSATARIVAAQVLVESMANRLRVNNAVVTTALDDVINQLASSSMTEPTASLTTTAGMLAQARAGVEAALAIAPTAQLEALQAVLNDLSPGMSPADVRDVLPSDAELRLDDAVSQTTAGDDADIDMINDVGSASIAGADNNATLQISGTPSSDVVVGSQYAFTPTADGGNEGSLAFSISGKPAWATFDDSTGRLAGTPDAGDVATYGNIVISVTDGEDSASLAAFSISVNAIGNGAATLSWTPPTENMDGSTLDNLAGYTVHWGKDPGDYSNSVDVDAGITSYMVDNLSSGTWYFAMRAYNESGAQSDYSNEASKTIQ